MKVELGNSGMLHNIFVAAHSLSFIAHYLLTHLPCCIPSRTLVAHFSKIILIIESIHCCQHSTIAASS